MPRSGHPRLADAVVRDADPPGLAAAECPVDKRLASPSTCTCRGRNGGEERGQQHDENAEQRPQPKHPHQLLVDRRQVVFSLPEASRQARPRGKGVPATQRHQRPDQEHLPEKDLAKWALDEHRERAQTGDGAEERQRGEQGEPVGAEIQELAWRPHVTLTVEIIPFHFRYGHAAR